MADFEIQPANPSPQRYQDLMQACFGQAPSAEYVQWKYAASPVGKLVGFEASHEGRLAAFYGVIPWALQAGEKQVRVFQSMDTMTHPDFQRRGLFSRLALATYAEIEARDPDSVIIGIPGPSSLPGFVGKLGWTHVLDSTYVFRPRVFGDTGDARVTARITGAMDESLRAYLKGRTGRSAGLEAGLDPDFFEWRVLRKPAATHETLVLERGKEILGVAVTTTGAEGRACVEFLDCGAAELWNDAIGAVTRHLFTQSGVSWVYTWKPRDPVRARAFSRARFLSNPFRRGPFSYRVPFIVRTRAKTIAGVDPSSAASYDLQPLVQD